MMRGTTAASAATMMTMTMKLPVITTVAEVTGERGASDDGV